MRVVAGDHRGRLIAAPPGDQVRPTADRVREAVFNSLCHGNGRIGHGNFVAGAPVLDGFAGTGAMGIEAASRGAAQVTCIDIDQVSLACCRDNVAALGEQARITVLSGDCLNPVRASEPCSLVFLDPPYGQGMAGPGLAALGQSGWIASGALCVIEAGAREDIELPEDAALLDERRYGKAKILFVRWQAADGD